MCLSTRAWAEFAKAPDLAKLEIDFQQVSKSDQRARFPFLDVLSEVQLSLIDFFRGNWTNALRHAQASRRDSRRSFGDLGAGILFRQMAYSGDRDGAFAILEERREWLPVIAEPNTRGSWYMLALVIEGLVIMGERSQAGQLYPLVRELLGTGAVALWPIARFSQTIAGAAAAAAGKWETAEQHFQIARLQADSFPNRFEQTEIRRFHAMMLIDRSVSADREKAQALLSEALESYSKIGMPRHIEMTRALLDKAG
jgi:hypothetical protein